MNYKNQSHIGSLHVSDLSSPLTGASYFKAFFPEISQLLICEPISSFPNLMESLSKIKKNSDGSDLVYKELKEIEKLFYSSRIPSPEELSNSILEDLFLLVSNSPDEATRNICLKILSILSYNNLNSDLHLDSKNIENFVNGKIVTVLFRILKKKNVLFNNMNDFLIRNQIYILAILRNLFHAPIYKDHFYLMYMNMDLFPIMNDFLNSCSSIQIIHLVFGLLKEILDFSIEKGEDLSTYNLFIPALLQLVSVKDVCQKYSLKIIHKLITNSNNMCLIFAQNNLPQLLYNEINYSAVSYFMRCINAICSSEIVKPFDQIDFYQEKILVFLRQSYKKEAKYLLHFISLILEKFTNIYKSFNFDELNQIILDCFETQDFVNKTEMIKLIVQNLNKMQYNVSSIYEKKILEAIIGILSELDDNTIILALNVFNTYFESNYDLMKSISLEYDFYDILQNLNKSENVEIAELSSIILSKYLSDL